MLLKLFLAFTIIPALELYLLIRLGELMGAGATVLLILVTGAVGAALAKREGFRVLRDIQRDAQAGFPSGDRLVEGLMVLVGGLLLVTPGVLTDLTGFTLIAPPTRRFLAPLVKAAVMARVQVMGVNAGPAQPHSSPHVSAHRAKREPQAPAGKGAGPFDHPTF